MCHFFQKTKYYNEYFKVRLKRLPCRGTSDMQPVPTAAGHAAARAASGGTARQWRGRSALGQPGSAAGHQLVRPGTAPRTRREPAASG